MKYNLASMVQSSEDAIIRKSIDGIIIYWNVGVERIFEYSSKEVLEKFINILAPHRRDEHKENLGWWMDKMFVMHLSRFFLKHKKN